MNVRFLAMRKMCKYTNTIINKYLGYGIPYSIGVKNFMMWYFTGVINADLFIYC